MCGLLKRAEDIHLRTCRMEGKEVLSHRGLTMHQRLSLRMKKCSELLVCKGSGLRSALCLKRM